ncbi:MAG: fasciclin domain-containing protein [Chloroherpetonaceae bacterium]|nr:fasciclin domain-containing protein [Chthonomonadaceae bacterium]MDW8208666.1 fasciclin domain-containing protein [Chloroherpetonaceae bacterium]
MVKLGLLALALCAAPVARAEDIVDTAVKAGNFKTLVAAVKAADLVETLKGDGPFTVFAPTDAAFKKVPAKVLNFLLKPENKSALVKVLTYHVVSGKVMSSDVKTGDVATVQGEKIKLKAGKGGVTVNRAKVIKADIEADNGVIHVIDTVIIPPSLNKTIANIK